MGGLCKVVDALLLLFFVTIAIAAPLIDAQLCLPTHLFPSFVVDLTTKYAQRYEDHLFLEKPNFLIGIVWLELIFEWPLALACIYGVVARKSWFRTTSLMFGVCSFSNMFPILAELILSKRASDKLLMMYCSFVGLAVLAVLRGLLTCSEGSTLRHRQKKA